VPLPSTCTKLIQKHSSLLFPLSGADLAFFNHYMEPEDYS